MTPDANYYSSSYNNNSGMSNYKLYYFTIRGTAEAPRMIFHYSGVPFEDIRISMEEWPKWKGSKRMKFRFFIKVQIS
jgi:hypothetical protein